MCATTISAPVRVGQSWTHALRIALATLAILVVLAAAFVVGRATVSASHAPAIAPTTGVQTSTSTCRMGRPC